MKVQMPDQTAALGFDLGINISTPYPSSCIPTLNTSYTEKSHEKCWDEGTFLKCQKTTNCIWLACLFPILPWLHDERCQKQHSYRIFSTETTRMLFLMVWATVQQYGVIWKITVLETNIFPLQWFKIDRVSPKNYAPLQDGELFLESSFEITTLLLELER